MKNAVFALIAILLILGVVELVLWAAGSPTLLSERDPFLGFSAQIRVYELDGAAGIYRSRRRAVQHSFNYQEFLADKPENGFRFFVLGGSSAYGFPWGADQAFTRALGDALQASWPERKIEAVNAAAMSYGSHRLRILASELLQYEPDALVVYAGHNEFIERRFYRDLLDRDPSLDRVQRALFRWRLYSLMSRLFEKRSAGGETVKHDTGAWLGLDVVREYSVDVTDAQKSEVRELFEENLRAILDLAGRRGIPVVLCTVSSNLPDWSPNRSSFAREVTTDDRRTAQRLLDEGRAALKTNDASTAVERLERARDLAAGYAEIDFRLGRAYAALGRWDEARRAFRRARDHDAQPGRAISALNETIRRLGGEKSVVLVDVERGLEQASPHGLPGFDVFEDYVHPKPAAHRLIALELWKAFQEKGLLGRKGPADAETFWSAVGGETNGAATGPIDAPLATVDPKTPALLFNLGVVLEHQGRIDEAIANYRKCVELGPGYYVAHTNLGRLLLRKGLHADAAVEFRRALEIEPRHVNSMAGLGEALLQLGRADRAEEVLQRATDVDPGSAPAWNGLGAVLTRRGRHAEAAVAFRRAADLNPNHADTRANLGFALLFQGKFAEAEAAFAGCLDLQPDHLGAHNGLGVALTEQGRLDAAEERFTEALRIDPRDPAARDGLAEVERRRAAGS